MLMTSGFAQIRNFLRERYCCSIIAFNRHFLCLCEEIFHRKTIATTGLVFIQDDRMLCMIISPVESYITLRCWFLPSSYSTCSSASSAWIISSKSGFGAILHIVASAILQSNGSSIWTMPVWKESNGILTGIVLASLNTSGCIRRYESLSIVFEESSNYMILHKAICYRKKKNILLPLLLNMYDEFHHNMMLTIPLLIS